VIKDCTNYGTVKGLENVGGIVGYNDGTVENCMSNAEIVAESTVGGIARLS